MFIKKMPIYSIILLNKITKSTISKITYLNDFNFWERPKVNEFIDMASHYITAKCDCTSYKAINYQGYICHINITSEGLSGVLISDELYPTRVAYECLYNYIKQFLDKGLPWKSIITDINYNFLPEYIKTIQQPNNVDKLIKIREELEETREIIISNIDELLNRNDKLNDLEQRTERLLIETKHFKDSTESLNRCCIIF